MAARSQPQIVCPLVASCCPGPPIAGAPQTVPCCSPTGTLCGSAISIVAAPDPSTAGRAVTVSGLIPGAGAGTPVTLWQKLASESSFHSVATASTTSSGRYGFALGKGAVQTNREWYVSTSSERSVTVHQRVAAQVTLTRTLHVHVTPNHGGERISLEQRLGSRWTVIARARLSGSSSAVITAAVSANHPVKLRAVLPGDRRNLASYSQVIDL